MPEFSVALAKADDRRALVTTSSCSKFFQPRQPCDTARTYTYPPHPHTPRGGILTSSRLVQYLVDSRAPDPELTCDLGRPLTVSTQV